MDRTTITAFMHEQVAAWNRGDKEGFFGAYRKVAPNGLRIEYVGRGPAGDGWPVLEHMWMQQSEKVEIEELAVIVAGNEAASHNRNKVRHSTMVIETIESYRFDDDGRLSVRYFIAAP